jgi:anti-sigma factor RsiW
VNSTHTHLTADELAAFAEGRLSRSARTEVLRHLAECAGCRECAFMLTPAATDMQKPPGPARRWALAAAAACLATLAGFSISLRSNQPEFAAIRTVHRSRPASAERLSLSARADAVRFQQIQLSRVTPSRPRPNQFVVQTSHGERWISFEATKLFERE